MCELARQGHDVTVVNSHEAPLPDGVRRIHADRAARRALGPLRDEFDAVFDNTAYRPTDLEPMVELFAGRVRHFVFTSSVAVYKRSYVQPVHEGSPTHAADDEDPRKAYGVDKVQSERFVLGHDHLPATCLRVTHTIGPTARS